jgi:hypothetical protein
MSAAGLLDDEALLVALVLAPATYSRNRFFDMYTQPAMRRVRRRASLVRSIVRHLARASAEGDREPMELTIQTADDGAAEIRYYVPALGLRRTTLLEPVEAALVRFALARVKGGLSGEQAALPADDPDRIRVEAALRRLAPLARHTEGMYPNAQQDPIG